MAQSNYFCQASVVLVVVSHMQSRMYFTMLKNKPYWVSVLANVGERY